VNAVGARGLGALGVEDPALLEVIPDGVRVAERHPWRLFDAGDGLHSLKINLRLAYREKWLPSNFASRSSQLPILDRMPPRQENVKGD